MSDVLVKPAHLSAFVDSGDPTRFGPNWWNEARVFSGGANGDLPFRDSGSATGASWRTFVYDVRAYGTVANGTTDDSVAINNALTAAGNAGGGVVWMPAGTYATTRVLVVPSKVTLCGAGIGATVILPKSGALTSYSAAGQAWGGVIAAAGVARVTIRDLTIDLATNGSDANGVELGYDGNGVETSYATVTGIRILGKTNIHSYQIWNRRARHTRILGNWIDGNDSSPSATDVDHTGIEVFGGTDVVIAQNTVLNLNGVGIAIYTNAATSGADGVLISGNHVENCSQAIGMTASVVSTVAQNITNVRVLGNLGRTCPYACLHVAVPSGATVEALSVVGNTFTDAQYPVHLFGDAGSLWAAISVIGNVCERATTSNSGIISCTRLTNFTIAHNVLRTSVFDGINCSTCSDGRISDNAIELATHIGLYSTVSVAIAIECNRVHEWDTTNAAQPGIAGDGSNCTIAGNVFSRAAGQPRGVLWNSGDRTNVVRNRLLYTATSTPFSNSSTNASTGNFTFTNLETNHTVNNSQATNNSYITVMQNGGTARVVAKVVTGSGAFTVYLTTAADGTEVFKFEIMQ